MNIGRSESILAWLLSQQKIAEGEGYPEFRQWKPVYLEGIKKWELPIERAIAGGFMADRVAWAFSAGYQAALQHLFAFLAVDSIAALCVSEEGGAHPGKIQTTIEKAASQPADSPVWKLNGSKKFITNAREAEILLIAASIGEFPDGRNQIQMVFVEKNTPGITVIPMKELPFVPEVSHGILQLEDVTVNEANFLPGDGYRDFIKPFRTIEDIHVSAAIVGYLFRTAVRFGWPRSIQEKCLGLIECFRALSAEDPKDPAGHIVLGWSLQETSRLMAEMDPLWETTDKDTRDSWLRDRKLMSIAGEARGKRLHSAWDFVERKRV